jgi:alpha-L-rhamnosidase
VSASYHSSYGLIKSSYRKTDQEFAWNLTIPPNTTALVHIPTSSKDKVIEKIGNIKDLKFIKMESGRALYELGSGNYSFSVVNK